MGGKGGGHFSESIKNPPPPATPREDLGGSIVLKSRAMGSLWFGNGDPGHSKGLKVKVSNQNQGPPQRIVLGLLKLLENKFSKALN